MKQVRTRFLIKLRDPKGDETTWGFEQYGRVTSKTNAAGIEVLQK
jgi:YD repeat-containing protein